MGLDGALAVSAADLSRSQGSADEERVEDASRVDPFFGTEFLYDEEIFETPSGRWQTPRTVQWNKRKKLQDEERYEPWRMPNNVRSLVGGVPDQWPMGPHVYFLGYLPRRMVKIGFSKNLVYRCASLASQTPVRMHLLGWRFAPRGRSHEKALHIRWQDYRIYGEWFHCQADLREWILEHIDTYRRAFVRKSLDAGQDCVTKWPAR